MPLVAPCPYLRQLDPGALHLLQGSNIEHCADALVLVIGGHCQQEDFTGVTLQFEDDETNGPAITVGDQHMDVSSGQACFLHTLLLALAPVRIDQGEDSRPQDHAKGVEHRFPGAQ
jgi:hypothetical protein